MKRKKIAFIGRKIPRRRISLYFTNRKRYYYQKIRQEELKLNLKYQRLIGRKLVIRRKPLRKIRKPIKRIIPRIAKPVVIIKEERRRKQIVIYRKDLDAPSPEVYAEIRIATINPEITLKGLWVVLNRIKGRYPRINFTDVGLEEDEPISPFEDTELNDNNIHIKILAYGKESSSIIKPF